MKIEGQDDHYKCTLVRPLCLSFFARETDRRAIETKERQREKETLTVVVKLTQLLRKLRGVEPVTSSHWARVVPPSQQNINTSP